MIDKDLLEYMNAQQQSVDEDEGLFEDDESSLMFRTLVEQWKRVSEELARASAMRSDVEQRRIDAYRAIEEEFMLWRKTLGDSFPTSPAYNHVKNMYELCRNVLVEQGRYTDELVAVYNKCVELLNELEETIRDIFAELERLRGQAEVFRVKKRIDRRFEDFEKIGIRGSAGH